MLEKRGLWKRRCLHFDFGSELRRLARSRRPAKPFTKHDIAVVRHVLSTGALLKDNQFGIAMKTLKCFLSRNRAGEEDLVVLNGLPRHAGQARQIGVPMKIGLVVYLHCPDARVVHRIVSNAGGDRTGRVDDSMAEVAAKLKVFRTRTRPLVAHFRRKGIQVKRFAVDVDTEPEDIRQLLEGMPDVRDSILNRET